MFLHCIASNTYNKFFFLFFFLNKTKNTKCDAKKKKSKKEMAETKENLNVQLVV